MKPNPFHVLGLPVTADDETVVEHARDLALVAEAREERALAEWAKDELTGRPETRRLHAFLEAPDTDYRAERWDDFARRHRRPPVTPGSLTGNAAPPTAGDFDLAAVVRLLVEGLLTPPDVDVRPALQAAPVPFRLPERPPLEVRDVLFG
ncbi:hypothetical protein [Streptomyces litchfieldiae]|uniref:Uncharacterized protein n=1 Tax=Streptomyces litchfieldiae TaxID=3075543 RepID=A0ABU2MLI2_9ACTN|nr:hypothetical protein [Streptomyces sp. DSM 44938]MDT0341984.1 hypothetical protein [Streptomyces sp. DSM 44938]